MEPASMTGLDIAKRVFQVHGTDASGRAVFRKRLVRGKVPASFRRSRPARWRWGHI